MAGKRSDIKITNKAIAAYCKREHAMQVRVYPPKIAANTMTEHEARLYWCIIQELGEMAQLLEERGMDWRELKEMILLGVKVKSPKAEQQQLFK
jgi:hypothetical protein